MALFVRDKTLKPALLQCHCSVKFLRHFLLLDTDWKSAPSHALVQPIIMLPHEGDEYKLKPNGTGSFGETQVYHLQTGISYYLNCDAVGVLVNDPFTVAAMYANGSIHSTFGELILGLPC